MSHIIGQSNKLKTWMFAEFDFAVSPIEGKEIPAINFWPMTLDPIRSLAINFPKA